MIKAWNLGALRQQLLHLRDACMKTCSMHSTSWQERRFSTHGECWCPSRLGRVCDRSTEKEALTLGYERFMETFAKKHNNNNGGLGRNGSRRRGRESVNWGIRTLSLTKALILPAGAAEGCTH